MSVMKSEYVFGVLAVTFLLAGFVALVRDHGRLEPQSQTWLTMGVTLGVTSAWLFYQS
jgi:hypothetical protein